MIGLLLVCAPTLAEPGAKLEMRAAPGKPSLSGWYELQPESRWSPSRELLKAMQSSIQSAAGASVKPQLAPDLSLYFVQYFAQGLAGEGRVTLLGACQISEKVAADPRRQVWSPMDGGDCFFVAVYDAKKRAFASFAFNGRA